MIENPLSLPVALTHPARLHARALAYGLGEASLGRFGLLQIGCGDGGNLLPMAWQFPEARLVGIDRDAERIAEARLAAERCGLSNLTFIEAEAFAPAEHEPFDFAVAHGVYSWVDAEAQGRILATCARALAPSGVACVSYNTLPGWSLRGVVRGIMLAAGRGRSGEERMTAVRSRLAKLRRHLPEKGGAYAAMLGAELELAQAKTDAELLDDHLAEHNEPLYVEQFVARAAEHDLDYVGELVPATADGALELALPAQLMKDGLTRIEAEQSLDLLCYRQLRATLLCRADASRREQPELDHLAEDGYLAGRLRPQSEEPLLGPGKPLGFETPSGAVIEADQPLLKATLMALVDSWPVGLKAQALISEALDRLRERGLVGEAGIGEEEIAATTADLLELCRRQQLELWAWTPTVRRAIPERPRVFDLARLEAERGAFVTSPRHEPMRLDELTRTVIGLLDGTRDYNELAQEIGNRMDAGAFRLEQELSFAQRHDAIAGLVLRVVVQIRDFGLLAFDE